MNVTQRTKLFQAVESSYRELEPFRVMQQSLIMEYAGDGYGGGGPDAKRREIIVNLMNQTVDAYMITLAANRPQVLLSTKHQDLQGFAAHFQVAVNNLIEEIGLEQTIRRWVLDAFFCVGFVKVHMADSALVEISPDVWMDPGKPFASNVSLDNWVHDMSATKWTEMQFCGDAYRIPLEDLEDETVFDQNAVASLRPTSKGEADEERLENISRGYETDPDEFISMVDLVDLYIPREGVIYTFPLEFRHGVMKPYGEPVAEMEWNGPEFGPYHKLAFNEVPENIMPSSPASHLNSLAKHINNVYRKQVKGARRQKSLTGFTPGAEKSARNVQSANDGDMISVQDPNEVFPIQMGGIDPNNQQFLLGMMEHYNMAAGNLTAMLGLGAQAQTVGQEKLIHGAVSGKTAQMAYRVSDAVTSLVRDLGHMLWHDQVNVVPGETTIEGTDIVVDSTWTPEDREGDFLDYNFQIDVYSMQYKSPSERINTIVSLITQVYGPMGQMMMQQGGMIDFQKLTELLADLSNLPRLKDVVKFSSPMYTEEPGPQGEQLSFNAPKEYVHRNVPTGGTEQGRNMAQQQMWANQATPQQINQMNLPPA